MHYEIHTEIDIAAPSDAVWQVLTDLERYADWNPFITSAEGRLEVGEKLINRIEPPGGKAMTFKPQVTVLEPRKALEWLGKLAFAGVFDGRHRFEVDVSPIGTKLTQTEFFDGLLVGLLRNSIDTHTKAGFEAMNLALKDRAESMVAG